MIPHSTITEEFTKKKERSQINPFLIKFSYELLQSPWKSAFNETKKIDKSLDKGSFLTQLKNLAQLYDGLTFDQYDDIESRNAFDYYFKKEYSLGLKNLHHILSVAGESKINLTAKAINDIQKIPIIYSKALITDNIINQPDTALQYQKIIMTVYRLFFLMVYCLGKDENTDRKKRIPKGTVLSPHPNSVYYTCEEHLFPYLSFFTGIDYGALLSNTNWRKIKYCYPYAEECIDMMLYNWSEHFNNYDEIKKHFASLYSQCSTTTKRAIREYAATSIPNISLPEL